MTETAAQRKNLIVVQFDCHDAYDEFLEGQGLVSRDTWNVVAADLDPSIVLSYYSPAGDIVADLAGRDRTDTDQRVQVATMDQLNDAEIDELLAHGVEILEIPRPAVGEGVWW